MGTVQRQIDATVDVMRQNIVKMTERGEAVEQLLEKSDDLTQTSTEFSSRSRQLERHMLWQNWKRTLIVLGIVALVWLFAYLIDRTHTLFWVVFALSIVGALVYGYVLFREYRAEHGSGADGRGVEMFTRRTPSV